MPDLENYSNLGMNCKCSSKPIFCHLMNTGAKLLASEEFLTYISKRTSIPRF